VEPRIGGARLRVQAVRGKYGTAAMNHPHKIDPGHAHAFDSRWAEAIAREMAIPVGIVARVYREELQALASEARIAQFLQVIAGRRARLRLRQHRFH
jgi:uncharacterized protein DUF3562